MTVTLAVLADYANVSREGKLNVLGIFDVIQAARFPIVHNQMHLVMRFEADITERDSQRGLVVQLIDDDGKQLLRLEGQVPVRDIKPGDLFITNQILTIQNLTFARPGHYRFDIFVDNQLKRQVPLKVLAVPAPPAP